MRFNYSFGFNRRDLRSIVRALIKLIDKYYRMGYNKLECLRAAFLATFCSIVWPSLLYDILRCYCSNSVMLLFGLDIFIVLSYWLSYFNKTKIFGQLISVCYEYLFISSCQYRNHINRMKVSRNKVILISISTLIINSYNLFRKKISTGNFLCSIEKTLK